MNWDKNKNILAAICSHLRSFELFLYSILDDEFFKYYNLYWDEVNKQNSTQFVKIPVLPKYEAVRCTRLAEFHFLFDKLKIGQLKCTIDANMKVLMGYPAGSSIPSGDYYLSTDSEPGSNPEAGKFGYALGADGTRPYLDNNGVIDAFNFQWCYCLSLVVSAAVKMIWTLLSD